MQRRKHGTEYKNCIYYLLVWLRMQMKQKFTTKLFEFNVKHRVPPSNQQQDTVRLVFSFCLKTLEASLNTLELTVSERNKNAERKMAAMVANHQTAVNEIASTKATVFILLQLLFETFTLTWIATLICLLSRFLTNRIYSVTRCK